MFKVKKNKTTQIIITCLIYFAVLVLIYIFIALPISRRSDRLRSELGLQNKTLKEYEDLIRSYPNPEKEIEMIEAKIEELKVKAASREPIARIIQQLARKTNELNINTLSIRPKEDIRYAQEQLPEGVSKVYIEIVMLSTYKVVGDYLKALTELPIILTVESMSIQKQQEIPLSQSASGDVELLVTLLLSAYMVLEI